jgi:hypothetical protein
MPFKVEADWWKGNQDSISSAWVHPQVDGDGLAQYFMLDDASNAQSGIPNLGRDALRRVP